MRNDTLLLTKKENPQFHRPNQIITCNTPCNGNPSAWGAKKSNWLRVLGESVTYGLFARSRAGLEACNTSFTSPQQYLEIPRQNPKPLAPFHHVSKASVLKRTYSRVATEAGATAVAAEGAAATGAGAAGAGATSSSSGNRIVLFVGSNATVGGVAVPTLPPPFPTSPSTTSSSRLYSLITVPPIRQTGRTEFAREGAGLRVSRELRRDDAAVAVVKVGRRRPMLLTRLPMWKGARLPSPVAAGSSVTLREMVRGR